MKFNLILLVIFGIGALLIAHYSYVFLIGNANREVMQQAQLMMASAQSVRDYTTSDLSPLLTQLPGHRVRFLAETVPAYGATTTFATLRKSYPDYDYKEATLNPTNPRDRATDWESDIIRNLSDHPDLQETNGERDSATGRSLYLAHPIRIKDPSCLQCHSIPSAAPKAMLTVYGPNNGFGWKQGTVVGAQIISVPTTVPIAIADQAFHRLLFFLGITLILAILALDGGVYWFVIRPLKIVSDAADRVSRGEKNVPPLVISGSDEIATVTSSFNRMQLSLTKALKMLEDD